MTTTFQGNPYNSFGGWGQNPISQGFNLGFNPSMFGQYQALLPPSGTQIQDIGFSGAAGNAINQLYGIRGTQLADFISSQNLQRFGGLQQGQTDLALAGALIPQQLAQQAGFQGQEYNLLSQSPEFASQIQNFQTGQAGANYLAGALPGIGQNVGALQGGISDILKGGLPQGLSDTLQDSFASTAAAFGLDRSAAGLQGVNQALGSSLSQIQTSLLGAYSGASGSLLNQGQGVLQSLFGAAGQNVPGYGSLLANTGVPDVGFGPIGFGGAAGVYGKTLAQDQAATQNRRNAYGAYGNMGLNLVGSILGAGGAAGGFGSLFGL